MEALKDSVRSKIIGSQSIGTVEEALHFKNRDCRKKNTLKNQ